MQHLVEGLSVVALSYYTVGLISYLLKGAEAADEAFPALQILGAVTPIIVLVVALVMRRLKRSLNHLDEGIDS